ncbi:MAG: Gfo/Idh/MocA family oxidoreductase [Nanoarchaeota archaeon]|nr:Gfo/Idh/MocA family oxidoreductase [Nanoarchaeota archaeon]MBU1051168.1 Gfo/Idh/MocA family oxidoreductase [Nanoarchaeota archaeon]MBU1988923.1 Gfo/Idh/MocA family oxidoreductase [Nanoarchaeota archaeon]
MKIGIIGAGNWGKNLLRVFNDFASVKWCAKKTDTIWVNSNYPQIKTTLDYREILKDEEVKAVVISTPIKELSTIAYESLKAGKHVFLEKPMAQNAEEAKKLIEIANEKILFIGYVYLYHPIFQRIKKIISSDPPVQIDTNWRKFGTFDNDIILNLVSHDLSILVGLFGSVPERTKIVRKEKIISEIDVIALDLEFNSGKKATININRAHPLKSKEVRIKTESGKILYWIDEKLDELDKQKNCFELRFENEEESLKMECLEFLRSVEENTEPISNGKLGLQILEILETLKSGD